MENLLVNVVKNSKIFAKKAKNDEALNDFATKEDF